MKLLMEVKPNQNMKAAEMAYWLNEEMARVLDEKTFRALTDPIELKRADHLVKSHT